MLPAVSYQGRQRRVCPCSECHSATCSRSRTLQAVLACLLIAVGTFSDIVAYFIFVTVAFIAASVAALFRLPPPADGYRTPLRTIMPAVFIGLCALLLVMLLAGRPVQALLGVAVVAAGIPVYRGLRSLSS